jgi:hypothetical protein
MPGRHINDQQVRLYMTAHIIRPQATAAAMAGQRQRPAPSLIHHSDRGSPNTLPVSMSISSP